MTTDPRGLGGDTAGPGGPTDRDSVVFDTRNAVLVDNVVAAVMHGPADVFGVLLEGRIAQLERRKVDLRAEGLL